MKKTIVIISFFTLSILSLLSCSKSKDASLSSFSGIKIRVDGTEYSLPQSQYQFLIEKRVSGGQISYGLITRTPSSPEINSVAFSFRTSTLTPGVYENVSFGIKINRTASGGYYFSSKYYIFGSQIQTDGRITLTNKSNGSGTGDFSVTCWSYDQRGVQTSQEYSIQGNFYNIPILE